MIARAAALTLLLTAAPAFAQEAAKPAPPAPIKIPAPGGEVVIPHPGFKAAYDEYKYAPARRVGDLLFVSGAVVGRMPGEGGDVESFKKQARRAFQQLGMTLKAAGTDFSNVAMINSFHDWNALPLPRDEQIKLLNEVKSEFMSAPHPAWTAVGVTGLLEPGGAVEIQLIAYVPGAK